MTVHVGQITSEVRSAAPAGASPAPDEVSVWDERRRVVAMLDRVAKDRRRTATGVADD